jgi:hypothetical protein
MFSTFLHFWQGRFAQENYITPEQEATLRRRALDILRGMLWTGICSIGMSLSHLQTALTLLSLCCHAVLTLLQAR